MRKNEFTKEEIKRLEELIKLRVTSARNDQKKNSTKYEGYWFLRQ